MLPGRAEFREEVVRAAMGVFDCSRAAILDTVYTGRYTPLR